ncbi:MAG: hypothetical protein QXI42_02305 [Thermoproteota archaeon]
MKILYSDEDVIVFRVKTIKEARAVSRLSRLAHFEDSRYSHFTRSAIRWDITLVLGLMVKGQLAGYLAYSRSPFFKQIYVLPEYRNRGFEGLLAEVAEKNPGSVLISRGLRAPGLKP